MYYLFAGPIYYAYGGANDFRGVFDSLDSALAAADTCIKESTWSEWWHITDINMNILERSREEAYS